MTSIREGAPPFAFRGQVCGSDDVTCEMEEVVDGIIALPFSAQLAVLRTVAPLVLENLDELDQEAFLAEVRKALDAGKEPVTNDVLGGEFDEPADAPRLSDEDTKTLEP